VSNHAHSSTTLVKWTKRDLFSQYGLELLPAGLTSLLFRLPVTRLANMRAVGKNLSEVAKRIVGNKTNALMKGLEGGKDLMSLLIRANANEEQSRKLSDIELISEIACAFRFLHYINISDNSLGLSFWQDVSVCSNNLQLNISMLFLFIQTRRLQIHSRGHCGSLQRTWTCNAEFGKKLMRLWTESERMARQRSDLTITIT
jgi:hypothetical protein